MYTSKELNQAWWKHHDPYQDDTLKQCPKCKQELVRSMFGRDDEKTDGLNICCCMCHQTQITHRQKANTKKCSKCKQELEHSMFRISYRTADGLSAQCRTCYSQAAAERRKNPVDPNTKRCSKCKQRLPFSMFRRSYTHASGHYPRCLACDKQSTGRSYKQQDPRKKIFSAAKRRAKERGREFSITLDDIVMPTYCPVLHIPLRAGKGKLCHNSPSLDRIDNNLGYIPGNVRIISWRANSLKSNGTLEEFLLVVEDLRKLQQQPTPLDLNQYLNRTRV